MTDMNFNGRVAVITGAGRGLGRSYALLLASRGCKVIINDNGSAKDGDGVLSNPAQEVVDEIKAAGGEAVACVDTVATPDGAAAIIQSAIDAYGRIDILIHNAGNVRYGPIAELSLEDFTAVTDVHMKGGFYLTQAAMRHMIPAKYGRIIQTSSISGLYGSSPSVNYGMSKAALLALTNVTALEGAAHNIKANAIIPAAVTRMAEGLDTSQYPAMEPELVAPMVAWLAHEDCSSTGEYFIAGAGRMARAFTTESKGVYQPNWSIEDIASNIDQIRDADGERWTFPPHPTGFGDHLGQTFAWAKAEAAKVA